MDYSKRVSIILKKIPSRGKEVIGRRFGLSKNGKRETLEAIGESYNLTRERVRQIEREGISLVKKQEIGDIFSQFEKAITTFGGIKKEDLLISFLGKGGFYNEIFFFLSLNDNLKRNLENKFSYSFWSVKKTESENHLKFINKAIEYLKKTKEPLFIEELYNNLNIKNTTLPVFQSYIEVSKQIQKNHKGKIGLKDWVEINPRGIKDKAYLVLKEAEKPLHFSEVATLIKNSSFFSSPSIHTATVHNELIKNEKFVLVGRGLYALKEWGYEPGVVKEIITKVLNVAKSPLSKEEILEEVLKKRMVKRHTVLLNLQDKNRFQKDNQGRYIIKEA